MKVTLHPHAAERMAERGVARDEVVTVVTEGERLPAKLGRVAFRRNFNYGKTWRGTHYALKQVEVVAVEESDRWLVITVIARYF